MNKNHVNLEAVHTHTHTRIPSSEKRCQSMIPRDEIIISQTEPVKNRRKVWIKKGKNLYNPETMPLMNGLWIIGTENIINNTGGWYVIVPISGGETYTVSKKNTRTDFSLLNFTLVTTETYPENNVDILQISSGSSYLNEYTITAQASAKYLFIGLAIGATLTDDMKIKAIEELQVELGSSKTSYEAFVEPSIFIKNTNGDYKEFIPKEEPIIKQYSFKGLTFSVIKYKRIVEISINGSTDQSLGVNTFYDLQLDDIFKPLKQVDDNITLSTTEAGMIRISPTGLFRIYPWTNLASDKGFRYTVTYISAY